MRDETQYCKCQNNRFLAIFLLFLFLYHHDVNSDEKSPYKRLKIIESELTLQNKTAKVYEVVQENGSKVIEYNEGESFNVLVENLISQPTALHWHGLILPCLDDGVPYVTQHPIGIQKTQLYRFPIVQTGTYFAHSHYGLQEQKLMTIPILFYPKNQQKERQIILFLEDFVFASVEEVWQKLRRAYPKNVSQFWIPPFSSPNKNQTADLNDLSFDAYLANRKVLEDPEKHLVQPSEKILLRIINASTATGFHVLLGKLVGKVIAVDGNAVEPISLQEFPIATAQRIDVHITIPKEGGAWPVLAQGQGTAMQTGLILHTPGFTVPSLSSNAKAKAGPITNAIEKKLHALHPLTVRKVDRKLLVELNGNMEYYVWALNRHVWPANRPLLVKENERVELEFVNRTNMSHPMHLHGHVFQVTAIDNIPLKGGAVRDTVLVMPNQSVKVEFDAVNPGIWALHCHIGYHLWGGMFTVLLYEGYKPPLFTDQEKMRYSQIYNSKP